MLAWRVHQYGPPAQVLTREECAGPECAEDGVVVDVAAAGVNFPDLLAIAGLYQVKAPLPFVPGVEAAGVVTAVGSKSRFTAGDRVIVNSPWGAFADSMAAADAQTFAVPPSMSDVDAAAFLVSYQTSYFALVHRAGLTAGEVLLVHGGAGGVGTSAIQLGKHLGARVIATAGAADKLELCRELGADEAINYRDDDFVARVKELTGGRGADVIYDPVGGEVTLQSTRCIAWNGRLLIIGFASGTIPSVPANRILLKNISIVGLYWGNYFREQPELVGEAHAALVELYQGGVIKPTVGARYPMADLPAALGAIAGRTALGKLVVENA